MSDLVKYDAACRAVAEAASIDEAKEFRDQSEAMRAYARQAKNKQMEAQAAEIRFRAERRIGELMAAQKDAGHLRPGNPDGFAVANGSERNPLVKPPTLEEVGIDKKTADRARKYAAIPEQEFNGIVGEWRERVEAENARVTVDLLDAGKKAQVRKGKSQEAPEDVGPVEPPNDPYGYAKLTEAALLETANGLREERDQYKARVERQRSEIADLKQSLKDFSSGSDMGARLSAKVKELQAVKYARDEAKAATKRMEYRLKKAEQERDEAVKRAESIEIPL